MVRFSQTKSPHVFFVEAQAHSAQMLISQCCTSTDPDLCCLFVTAALSPSKKQVPSEPSHSTHFSHQHTLVAEQVQCIFIDGGILARLNALEEGVRERDARIQHLKSFF